MYILKFGGSSVGSSSAINNVISIVKKSIKNGEEPVVVFSAFQGITNLLIELGETAAKGDGNYKYFIEKINSFHFKMIFELIPEGNDNTYKQATSLLDELNRFVLGIFLLKELSLKSKDQLMSFGERLSAVIINGAFCNAGINSEYLDAREVIITDKSFGNARVNFNESKALIETYKNNRTKLQVVTGFIGRTLDNETTTLGRGGSDYTASILGAALNAEEIQIWTDVDGVLTADPRKVKKAISINELSFEEALEMSHFGAKVIYPPTIRPAYLMSIPIRIKNTFNPSFKGTVITNNNSQKKFSITGISTIQNAALVKVEGSGLAEPSITSGKIFRLLWENKINILLISQASSGHSICFCVPGEKAYITQELIGNELKYELAEGIISNLSIETGVSIIAVVGENLRNMKGIPGKIFQSLGRNGISINAIAYGSSKLNISLVIKSNDESKALNAIHDEFFLSDHKAIHLYIVGTGLIGRTLFQQIKNQIDFLYKELYLEIKIIGIANTRKMLFNSAGIDINNWEASFQSEGINSNLDVFINQMIENNLSNSVFVDCTSSENVVEKYIDILSSSISIVTPNKKANSSSYNYYQDLRTAAHKHNVNFLYETNVGAGLPVISTLQDLVLSGDKIIRIEGVLSGTLSYLFNNFNGKIPFSELLKDACEKGFTEPDPKDDLNGLDVARKLLILIREAGYKIEFDEIEVENLIPKEIRNISNKEEFFEKLKLFDSVFESKYQNALKNDSVLRYIASYEDGKAVVKLLKVDSSHPFYSLSSNDNVISFKTIYYNERPIVIQGPGAGAKVTSGGVFADIVRIANYAL